VQGALKAARGLPKTADMGRVWAAVTRLPPMSAVPRWFKPLKQIVDAIFRHDLELRRDADGVRVVLSDRSVDPGQRRGTPAEEAAAKERQDVALMRSQLVTLLDERPETRNAMRHLAFVEQALGRKGLRALDKLPLDLMRHALEQLEGLVTNWSPVGLANLRAKMAVAILRRESMDADEGPDSYRTSDLHEEKPPRDAAGVVVLEREDEEALEAAYAAYAAMKSAPVGSTAVVMHGELDSPSDRAARAAAAGKAPLREVKLRQLET
jgi:hypothetical protein